MGPRVISNTQNEVHSIESYQFKELNLSDNESHIFTPDESHETTHQTSAFIQPETPTTPVMDSSFIEKLEDILSVMNNMESNFNMQTSRLDNHFEDDKQKSYEDGLKIGQEQSKSILFDEVTAIKARLLEGVKLLNDESKKLEHGIKELESELTHVAIDIAKQVVNKEISTNSSEIAYSLAQGLISELMEATKITIKVHPDDFVFLNQNFEGDKKVSIESDIALAKGGVVIISDVGNIDGTIKERFSNVKSTIFED